MATDDVSEASTEWIILYKSEDCSLKTENAAPEEEFIRSRHDDFNPVNEAAAVLPVVPDEFDDFSFLSMYDSLWDDTEITSGIRCYTHCRNVKLNKTLNLLVTLAIVMAAGLAIGNLVGLTKNCMHGAYKLDQFGNESYQILLPTFPQISPGQVFGETKPENTFDMNHKCGTLTRLGFPATRSSQPPSNEFSDFKNVPESCDDHRKGNSKPGSRKYPESIYENLSVVGSVITSDSYSVSSRIPFIMDSTWINTDAKESVFDIFGSDESLDFFTKGLLHTNHGTKVKNTRNDLLDNLRATIDDILQKAEDLVLNMPSRDSHKNPDFTDLDLTESMFSKLKYAINESLTELRSFLQTPYITNSPEGNKNLAKMCHTIIKSVDKLLKSIFKEALLKKEKSVKSRLEEVNEVGFKAIKKLRKNLSDVKNKLTYEKVKFGSYGKYESKHRFSHYQGKKFPKVEKKQSYDQYKKKDHNHDNRY